MTVGLKIKALRDEQGLTQVDLAKKSGISRASIQAYEKDDASITFSVIEKLAKALNVDVSYFLSPSQSNIVSKLSPSVHKSSPSQESTTTLQQSNIVKINYYPNVLVSAGYGVLNHNENKEVIELNRSFLVALGLKAFTNLDLIPVYGDSMEPFVSNGELVIIERSNEAKNSDIVIANINGEVYVKKLQKDPLGKWVKLTSLNAMYPDIELKEDELKYLSIIGIVKAKIRPF